MLTFFSSQRQILRCLQQGLKLRFTSFSAVFSILISSATKIATFSHFYSKTLFSYIITPLLPPLDLQLFEDWVLELRVSLAAL